MATTLDDLVTVLRAETASLRGDLNDALKMLNSTLDKMDKRSQKSAGTFDQLGKSLSRAFTVGAITAAATALIRMEDTLEVNAANLKDMALQANVSYEALQRLRFAADQNGSSAEDMDTALAKLTKSIGEARGGSEQLARVFKVLGLDDLIKKGASTESIFFGLADALKQVKDPAERSAIVLALMGKSSGTLANMMGQGADAVRDMADAMPSVAVMSDTLIDKLDASHDKTVELTKDLQGAGSVLAGWFVDGLHAAGEAAKFLIDQLGGLDTILKKVTDAWETYAGFVGPILEAEVGFVRDDIVAPLAQAYDYLVKITGLSASAKPAAPAASPFVRGGRGLLDAAPQIQSGISIPDIPSFPRGAGPRVDQAGVKTLFDPSAAAKTTAAAEKYDRVIASLSNQLKELGMSEEHAAYQQELFSALQRAGVTEDSARGQAIALLVAQIDDQRRATEAVAEAEQHRAEAAQEAQQLQQQLGETFADSVSSVALGMEKWDDALRNLLQSLAKAILQATILKALGLDPGGGVGGGIANAIFGRATGGGGSSGQPYLVGEKRPEIFVPDAPGRFMDARSMRGAGGVNVVQNFHGGITSADLRQAAAKIKDETLRAVKPLMIDAKRRGQLSGAF